jgi:amidophosphoribosyltransferase
MPIMHDCGIGLAYNSDDLLGDLYTLGIWNQHRGDESAGIALSMSPQVGLFRNYGTVHDLFTRTMHGVDVKSRSGIIHNRYSTTGASNENNMQPVRVKDVAIGHQGNLVNSAELRGKLGGIYSLKTALDSEVIACIFHEHPDPFEAAEACSEICHGAYNVVGVNGRGQLFAHRDPRGFHPLFMGTRDDSLFVSSEDMGLFALGLYEEGSIREIEPGETIVFSEHGPDSRIIKASGPLQKCFFEEIYFMLHGSSQGGVVVSDTRRSIGEIMAIKYPADADIVVPVMDSGLDYADGYRERSGMPMVQAIAKNRSIGRTYTTPEGKGESVSSLLDMSRMEKSMLKNVAIPSMVKGKRVVVTDDSIVRLNVAKGIASTLFRAGAEEVHFMIASPPIRYPCFFGMDHSSRRELAAATFKGVEDANEMIARQIADSVGTDHRRVTVNYLDIDDIRGPLRDEEDHCFSCLNGKYCCELPDTDRFKEAFEL